MTSYKVSIGFARQAKLTIETKYAHTSLALQPINFTWLVAVVAEYASNLYIGKRRNVGRI